MDALLKFDYMVITMIGFITMIAPNFRYYIAHKPEITKSVLLWQQIIGCFEFHVGISCYYAANMFAYYIIKRNEDRAAVLNGMKDIQKLMKNDNNTDKGTGDECKEKIERNRITSIDEDEEIHKLFEKESEGYIQFVYYHLLSFMIMFIATCVINWIAHLTILELLESLHWLAPIGIPIYVIVHIYYFMFMIN